MPTETEQQQAQCRSKPPVSRREHSAIHSLNSQHSVRNQATIYIGSAFLTIVAMATFSAFHEMHRRMPVERQVVAVNALEVTRIDRVQADVKEIKVAISPTPQPPSAKRGIHVASVNTPEQQQWTPPPLVESPESNTGFDPMVKAVQEDLLALGFSLGKADGFKGLQTKQALGEFSALYLPESPKQLTDARLAAVISAYASIVSSDAARFGLNRGVVAAIRLSSVRTGVEFSYLMKLAAAESNFKPEIEAKASSATGLYQFTRDTWLNTVKQHGARYGLGHYVSAIEFYVTRKGIQRPMVRDRAVRQHLLDLRKNPRLSAMMVAEMVIDSHRKLSFSLKREPSQTDLYLTHFLGTDGAIAFLKALDKTPHVHALDMFPAAARSNQDIFHPRTAGPRTVDEVYELFGNKFSTTRYDDLALN